MRYVRFRASGATEMKGILDGDTVTRIHGSFFQNHTVTDEIYSVADIIFLPPVLPRTIACFGGGLKSYMKSPASLEAGGSITLPPAGTLYCVPRLAFVLDKRTDLNVFGVMPMLDFITSPDYGDAASSGAGYTMTGPVMYNTLSVYSYSLRFSVGGRAVDVRPDSAGIADALQDVSSVRIVTGDIAAYALSSAVQCGKDDEITFQFEPETVLRAHIV